MKEPNSFMLFSGSSNKELAQDLAQVLGKNLGEIRIGPFPDREIEVEILENVRARDVFVIQSISRKPNDYLMELLIIIDALKRASAKSIQAIIPYYGYARQDRRYEGRAPITAKLVANLLETAGANRVLTIDLHTEQIQGFFDIPTENLYALDPLVEKLQKEDLNHPVVVSPDLGSNKMARRYAEFLQTDLAIVHKHRVHAAKVDSEGLLGEVSGRDVILVDDICSTGETLKKAAKICKRYGAKRIVALVTHYLLEEENSLDGIDKMYVTNSISSGKQQESVERVSVAPMLAKAIRGILSGESITSLCRL